MSNDLLSLAQELESADSLRTPNQYSKIERLDLDKDGRYKVRILPSVQPDVRVPFVIRKIHFYKNPNRPKALKTSPWTCLEKECPFCNAGYAKAKEEKDLPKENKTSWKLFPKVSAVYYVIDASENVRYIDASKAQDRKDKSGNFVNYKDGLHDEIMKEVAALLKQGVNVFDADSGRWCVIERRTKGKQVAWKVTFEYDAHSLSDEVRSVMTQLKPLQKMNYKHTVEQLQNVLDGVPWIQSQGGQAQSSGISLMDDDSDSFEAAPAKQSLATATRQAPPKASDVSVARQAAQQPVAQQASAPVAQVSADEIFGSDADVEVNNVDDLRKKIWG